MEGEVSEMNVYAELLWVGAKAGWPQLTPEELSAAALAALDGGDPEERITIRKMRELLEAELTARYGPPDVTPTEVDVAG